MKVRICFPCTVSSGLSTWLQGISAWSECLVVPVCKFIIRMCTYMYPRTVRLRKAYSLTTAKPSVVLFFFLIVPRLWHVSTRIHCHVCTIHMSVPCQSVMLYISVCIYMEIQPACYPSCSSRACLHTGWERGLILHVTEFHPSGWLRTFVAEAPCAGVISLSIRRAECFAVFGDDQCGCIQIPAYRCYTCSLIWRLLICPEADWVGD